MNKKSYFLVLFLISFTIAEINCQSKLKEGYIVTLENDTLYGFIKDGGQKKNMNACLFKSQEDSKDLVKYDPSEIKSYRISEEKSYVSKKVFYKDEYNFVFLELLIEGYLNLYYDFRNDRMAYYLEKEGMAFKGLEISPFEIGPNRAEGYYSDQYDEIRINIYRDTLYSVFEGSQEAFNKIDNLKYDIPDLMDITKTYIAENCEGDNCILFEKEIE